MDVAHYKTLYKRYKDQPVDEVFAHFHPEKDPLTGNLDFDAPFKKIAAKTLEGAAAWEFTQPKFQNNYPNKPPKLRNYLLYTFIRLRDLEIADPGKYFIVTDDQNWVCLNTGLQDRFAADLYAVFQKYAPPAAPAQVKPASDWVYRGTATARVGLSQSFRDKASCAGLVLHRQSRLHFQY